MAYKIYMLFAQIQQLKRAMLTIGLACVLRFLLISPTNLSVKLLVLQWIPRQFLQMDSIEN